MMDQFEFTYCRKNGGVGMKFGIDGGWWCDCIEDFENARTSEWHMGIGVASRVGESGLEVLGTIAAYSQ